MPRHKAVKTLLYNQAIKYKGVAAANNNNGEILKQLLKDKDIDVAKAAKELQRRRS